MLPLLQGRFSTPPLFCLFDNGMSFFQRMTQAVSVFFKIKQKYGTYLLISEKAKISPPRIKTKETLINLASFGFNLLSPKR